MKRTVLITGCSSGFGKTTAKYFADQGWNVIATMRNPGDGEDIKSPDITIKRLDVVEPASIKTAIEESITKFGKIDVLVNNAGFGLFGVFESTSVGQAEEQFNVNVFGVMNTIREILPHFRQNRAGVILNISSGAGAFTLPLLSLYCSSKFALEGFSEALSYELASLGIVVKIIEPGGVLSTNFGKRGGSEAEKSLSIRDYEPFVAKTMNVFAELRGQRLATEDDVAKVIFKAAVDGSSQLRYVATDDIVPLLKVRRETNEEEYIKFMRSRFTRN